MIPQCSLRIARRMPVDTNGMTSSQPCLKILGVVLGLTAQLAYSSATHGQQWIEGEVYASVESSCVMLNDLHSNARFELYGDAIRDLVLGEWVQAWGIRRDWVTPCMQGQPFEVLAWEPVDAPNESAMRRLPPYFVPGKPLTVCVTIPTPVHAFAMGLEDTPPEGWIVTEIGAGGRWDAVHRKTKWGPFFAPFPPELCYTVMSSTSATDEQCFVGAASFDGANDPVAGDQCVALDSDGDGVGDAQDNCPFTPNWDQANCDKDTAGDACDEDIDNDGIVNAMDACDFTPLAARGNLVRDHSHPLDGTLICDLDGDCDCDLRDWKLVQLTMSGPGPADQRSETTSICHNERLPDLVVTEVYLGTVQAVAGSTVRFAYSLANSGAEGPVGNSTFDVAAYFSVDPYLDPSDIEFGWGYSVWTYHLSRGWARSTADDGPTPQTLAAGEYYLIVVVDAKPGLPPNFYPGVEEANERNNWAVAPTKVRIIGQ